MNILVCLFNTENFKGFYLLFPFFSVIVISITILVMIFMIIITVAITVILILILILLTYRDLLGFGNLLDTTGTIVIVILNIILHRKGRPCRQCLVNTCKSISTLLVCILSQCIDISNYRFMDWLLIYNKNIFFCFTSVIHITYIIYYRFHI